MSEGAVQTSGGAPMTVASLIMDEKFQKQIRLALPRTGVTAERLARTVLTEIRRTPKLGQCSPHSLLGAIMQCAQLGLEPGPMGLAYLIPYGSEATFQLGYKGLLALLWRSDQISSISAEVVYAQDEFEWNEGSEAFVRFRRRLDGERGEPIAVFAAVTVKGGGNLVRVMSVPDVNEHRKRFSKAKSSPWDTDWDEMACKTVLKRVAKRAPVSVEAQAAIESDDRGESGLAPSMEIDVTPDADGGGEPGKASRSGAAKAAAKQKAGRSKGNGNGEPEQGSLT